MYQIYEVVGIQADGHSSNAIYDSAQKLIDQKAFTKDINIADIGGGSGEMGKRLITLGFTQLSRFDFKPKPNLIYKDIRHCNLNDHWPASDKEFDLIVCLEVIEHLENPRHFFRELSRILRPGGSAIVSTPNQLSLASKLCFLWRNEHQHFQDSCYPGHITPLLPKDFSRIASELNLTIVDVEYTNRGRIPFTQIYWQDVIPMLRGQSFSDNMLVYIIKP